MSKNKGIKAWSRLVLPNKKELQYKLDQYVQTGLLKPEEVDLIKQDPSALQSFIENPDILASQMGSLRKMESLSNGEMTDVDKMSMISNMQAAAQQEKANREAILSNARQRGIAGSGLEMAAQLAGEQGAANRANQAGIDAQVAAQQRGLQALQQAGQMASTMRGQDVDVAAKKAAAQDAINQWNAQNQQQMMLQNTQFRNQAQAQNLSEQQRLAEANVNQTNKEREIAANAAQQDFVNRMNKTQGYAQAQAAKNAAKGGKAGATLGAVGTLAGGAIGAYFGGPAGAAAGSQMGGAAGSALSDERAKEDIKEWNPSDFLDSIVPSKFKYKPEMHMGDDEYYGVMAQDVEAKNPEAVHEVDGLKHLDLQKLTPMILAAVANVHKRTKKLENK